MATLKVRKDLDDGLVEVDTGDGWRGLSPGAARGMADLYDGKSAGGAQQFADKLREYADDLEER